MKGKSVEVTGWPASECLGRNAARDALCRYHGNLSGAVVAVVSLRDTHLQMAEARAADATEPRRPLHWFTFAVKDMAATKGLLTTYDSPILPIFCCKTMSLWQRGC